MIIKKYVAKTEAEALETAYKNGFGEIRKEEIYDRKVKAPLLRIEQGLIVFLN